MESLKLIKTSQEIYMTNTTKTEMLSAFLDDESSEFEQRRLLDELQKDDELLQKMANYSLIGEVVRNEHSRIAVKTDFLAGIHAKLEDEPNYHGIQVKEEKIKKTPTWLRPAAGFAIAASIAAVAVVNIQSTMEPGKSSAAVFAQSVVQPAQKLMKVSASQPLFKANAAMRSRVQSYVNRHLKYASNTTAIMPSIRAVSYATKY